ncbi:MAG TPA: response regulator transcription factor [Drouetiella sp.]|jgi:DNA-binding response OmpR family regulator
MNILIVEDDARIAHPLQLHLRHEHHQVEVAHDGSTGLNMALEKQFDFILLDIMLPEMDGLTVAHKLRNAGCNSAIIMLTARDTIADKIAGLELGADDYLAKPFELSELSARIKAVSRRGREIERPLLVFEGLEVNQNACIASYRGTAIKLTPTEYRLLTHFLANPAKIYDKQDLLELLWRHNTSINDDIIKTHMKGLRNKLKAVGAPKDIIETVYGMGYRLKHNA